MNQFLCPPQLPCIQSVHLSSPIAEDQENIRKHVCSTQWLPHENGKVRWLYLFCWAEQIQHVWLVDYLPVRSFTGSLSRTLLSAIWFSELRIFNMVNPCKSDTPHLLDARIFEQNPWQLQLWLGWPRPPGLLRLWDHWLGLRGHSVPNGEAAWDGDGLTGTAKFFKGLQIIEIDLLWFTMVYILMVI